MDKDLQRRLEWVALIIILLSAATIRFWRLDSVPPGFTHDEAGHGHDAIAILNGARPIYQTVGYGREPLYDYLVAGLMGLLGPTGNILRVASVLFGLFTLLLTFAWVRLAFDGSTALATVALQAASFWSLSTSRQGLRSGLLPALFAAAVYFYWRFFDASERRRRWGLGLVPPLLGATLYTYIPARVLWILFPAYLIYLAVVHRDAYRRVWRSTLAVVLVALLLALPLFAYLRTNPGAEQRLEMLDAPLDALRQGDLSVLLQRAWSALAGLILPGEGDDFLAYTIPGRSVFDPLTGMLFLVGLALCVARWRRPAYAFSLLWFGIGLSPALITGATASSTRGIGALPVLYLFPALATVTGVRQIGARWGSRTARAAGVGFVGFVLATGVFSARDYFIAWGESPDVRAAYQHTLVEIARYLEHQPEDNMVALSSIFPSAPHDPYIVDVAMDRSDLKLRWFDARRALLLPSTGQSRLLVPSSASLDPYFAALPGLRLRERVTVGPDDLDPYFLRYDWAPQVTLAALHQQTQGFPSDFALPANFGNSLELLGYDLRTPTLSPGGSIELVTLWRVTHWEHMWPQKPADENAELVLFTHALDEANSLIAQEDRLDAPSWNWQTDDVIAQIHRFPLPMDLSAGTIILEVGVYRRGDLARLPLLVDGAVVADRVLLQPVDVVAW